MTDIKSTERVLLSAAFTLAASNSVVFALMGNLQDEYGFADWGLGFIAAAGFLTSFLMQVLVAPFADQGHTRRLLIGGTVLAVVGNAVFASGSSLPMFVLGRALAGAANGVFMPPAYATVASLDDEGKSERLGAMRGIDLAGFVTGPVIGGLLVGPLGLRWPFIIFASLAFVAMAIVSTQPIPALPRAAERQRLPFQLLRHRSVLVPVMFLVALALPVGIYDSLWDRFLTDIGASDAVVGLSLAVYAVPFVALSRFGGRLADRRGRLTICFTGLLVVAPLTALYGWFTVPLLPIAVGVIESCAQAAASPAASGMLAAGAPVGRASAAQGLAGACNQLVAAVVALVATWGYGQTSPRVLFTTAGVLLLVLGVTARALGAKLDDSPASLGASGGTSD